MTALLRFSGTLDRDPRIETWLDAQAGALDTLARTWFARLRVCGGDVREVFHDGVATACVRDVPFAYVGAFTAHVSVGFFHGAALPDPAALLVGAGKRMRHVKLRPEHPVDEVALTALIAAAYRDAVERIEND